MLDKAPHLTRKVTVALLLLLFAGATWATSDLFAGQWRLIAGCPEGYGVAVNLVQEGSLVSGTWDDLPFIEVSDQGLNFVGGRGGKLKGIVTGKIVSVQICTYNEASECNFEQGGTLERVDPDLVWVNKAFEQPESIPPRGARLVLSPGSADNRTWRCKRQ